eukprot:scaffold9371_cov211-Amphora_coffeaeformis.AAC.11
MRHTAYSIFTLPSTTIERMSSPYQVQGCPGATADIGKRVSINMLQYIVPQSIYGTCTRHV